VTDRSDSEREDSATNPASPGATPASTYGARSDGATQIDDKTIGELVFDVSERASVLVREEIELAKTEVTEKFNRLLRGSVVALVAGVFVVLALAMAMHGVAWLLNDLVFDDRFWPGFLIEAALFLLVAAGAGLYAYRAFKRGAPPTPDMAIEEAREIRSTLERS
jgi:uncharacterized membrane protein YqjE